MDSETSAGSLLEEELTCSVCHELFTDPVTLKCGHNFCRECVCEHWKKKTSRLCPMCRMDSSTIPLIPNHTLRNAVESLTKCGNKPKEESKYVCSQHREVLKLYCFEDQEAICLVCEKSRKHENHQFLPIEEAAQELKEEIKIALEPLQDTQEKLAELKEKYRINLNDIQDQTDKAEKQIKEDFVKLHRFLHEEEKNRLRTLKKEMKEKEQKIRAMEEISEYVYYEPEEPEDISVADIDGYMYTDRLQYRVWKKMLKIINPVTVTLDPDTAGPYLILSEDLTSVTAQAEWEDFSAYPERFDTCSCVLGSESFTSGRHSWVVDMGNKADWDLGVARESINRKGTIYLCPENGYWAIALRNEEEYYACTYEWTQIELESIPKKILVSLDYDAGRVSFYNADDMTCIYTFTENFTEELYPYFSPNNYNEGNNFDPLRICPL
nr:PREDICTED: nuclear factor 7, brain-like [Latimeria chalumnae]|eukprot:XP_005998769.2 PREDICTED: nuclear factor 7, brain-like [Latimeria chalumnae]